MRCPMIMIAVCCLLCACQQSPRKNYYILTAPEPDTTTIENDRERNIATVIGIGPVEVADYLQRLRMVYQTSGQSLIMSANDYWAEPLEKGIARVIAMNLTQRNATRSFVDFPWRSDSKPQYSLRLKIYSLDCSSSEARINAIWALVDNKKKNILQRHHFSLSASAHCGAKGVAEAYSGLLESLTSEMDKVLTQLQL